MKRTSLRDSLNLPRAARRHILSHVERGKTPLECVVAAAVLFPVMPDGDLELWRWWYVNEHGKRRQTRYHLTEADALARYGPSAKRLEWSHEVRKPLGHTSDWLKPPSRPR